MTSGRLRVLLYTLPVEASTVQFLLRTVLLKAVFIIAYFGAFRILEYLISDDELKLLRDDAVCSLQDQE